MTSAVDAFVGKEIKNLTAKRKVQDGRKSKLINLDELNASALKVRVALIFFYFFTTSDI